MNGIKQSKIIGICGAAGMGKTTLTHALGKALNATEVFWDDYDELSKDPEDYIKWYEQSRNYSDSTETIHYVL